MRIRSDSINDEAPIDARYAFGVPDAGAHMALGPNRSPHIAWTDVPEGTRSIAVICHDPDAPTSADDVNQEGRSVSATLPRTDFFHWVLVDVDPADGELVEGGHSDGVVAGGKTADAAPQGRPGVNTYTDFLAGSAELAGTYWGYDGPCPPWNDEIPHRYIFTVYALDVPRLEVDGAFTGEDVRQAIAGHVLAEASLTGTYSLNPEVPA